MAGLPAICQTAFGIAVERRGAAIPGGIKRDRKLKLSYW